MPGSCPLPCIQSPRLPFSLPPPWQCPGSSKPLLTPLTPPTDSEAPFRDYKNFLCLGVFPKSSLIYQNEKLFEVHCCFLLGTRMREQIRSTSVGEYSYFKI